MSKTFDLKLSYKFFFLDSKNSVMFVIILVFQSHNSTVIACVTCGVCFENGHNKLCGSFVENSYYNRKWFSQEF